MEFISVLWNYILPFLVLFTLLVFVHEMGHYSVARRNGVRVEIFSIGFGPELFGRDDRWGTRWKFCAIPLGGYVKMFGDADAASRPGEAVQRLTPEQRKVSFYHKSVGQRAAIVFAGPAVNYLFAVLILALLFMTAGQRHTPAVVGAVIPGGAAESAGLRTGDTIVQFAGRNIDRFEEVEQVALLHPGQALRIVVRRDNAERAFRLTPEPRTVRDKHGNTEVYGVLGAVRMVAPVVGRVLENSAAAEAGLMNGDRIVAIDGRPVSTFQEVRTVVMAGPEKRLRLRILRDGRSLGLTVVPKVYSYRDGAGVARTVGRIGIGVAPPPMKRHGPLAALWAAVGETWSLTVISATAIGQMFAGKRELRDIGGPLRIAEMSGDMAQIGIYAFVWFMAAISLSLCLINLLPVPMLDGGHLLYYGIEAIRGKPLGEKAQEFGFRIGMALVLGLMVVVTWNDLLRLFGAHGS
ncbi:MAG: RIP metalloprotease RseP [Rhodospirillaceae bacterium]|nr:RIP metalloprotease RseP [Rhodospirillaceae bacterium]MDE0254023.1 RIP metalloprotease RseP [Rhodospirillaceae bacterium]MDE0618853.1 RIP metalloprotease RseP [Rhodospirillaceae bacterium]